MKKTYYFSHDANARNDEKILMLRALLGWAAYGIYWALVEMMFEAEDSRLSLKKLQGIAAGLNINKDELEKIIEVCINEELFVADDYYFWSESLLKRKQKMEDIKEKRAKAGKKGSDKRWQDNNEKTSDSKPIANAKQMNSKYMANKKKRNEIKENDKTHYAERVFEDLWKQYPLKRGKGQIKQKQKIKIMEEVGEDQFARCIKRFKADMKKQKRDPTKYPYGSTFFNSCYVDYLDKNFEEESNPMLGSEDGYDDLVYNMREPDDE